MREIEIIFEDKDILVCRKPAGVATQTKRLGQQDMESLLKNYRAKKSEQPYIGIVHRLDQPVLEVFCSAKEHKGMVLELIRVYGGSVTLKDVLDSINYQMDKYEDLLFNHHLLKPAINIATEVMSAINDSKVDHV